MSSVFGHRPGAVYEDRAYSFRQRIPSARLLAAFAVGVVCAGLMTKLPALWSDVAGSPAAPAAAEAPPAAPVQPAVPAGAKRDVKKHVRVVGADRVAPPANAVGPAEATSSASGPAADSNSGSAPREELAAMAQPEAIPLPPPKPAELRIVAAPAPAPVTADARDGSTPPAPALRETENKPQQTASAEHDAREAAVQKAARDHDANEAAAQKAARDKARREAKRAKLARLAEQRARKARAQSLQAQNEADGFSLTRSYKLPDGRRVTVYRRHEGFGGGALAYGDDYSSRRFAPPPGAGLFSLFAN